MVIADDTGYVSKEFSQESRATPNFTCVASRLGEVCSAGLDADQCRSCVAGWSAFCRYKLKIAVSFMQVRESQCCISKAAFPNFCRFTPFCCGRWRPTSPSSWRCPGPRTTCENSLPSDCFLILCYLILFLFKLPLFAFDHVLDPLLTWSPLLSLLLVVLQEVHQRVRLRQPGLRAGGSLLLFAASIGMCD